MRLLCFFRDPDNVVLCLLATDETEDQDVALQIHFTLIQAFCCENDINILRVSNMSRLAEILGGSDKPGEPADLHCILINVGDILCLSGRMKRKGGGWAGSASLHSRAGPERGLLWVTMSLSHKARNGRHSLVCKLVVTECRLHTSLSHQGGIRGAKSTPRIVHQIQIIA